MTLRTCLLLSDDPDDHIEFTEALQEVSGNYVLMAVHDAAKAIQLLAFNKLLPDLLIVDLTVSGLDAERFFETVQRVELSHMSVVAYGDTMNLSMRSHPRIKVFLDDDMTYSDLRKVLTDVLNGAAYS